MMLDLGLPFLYPVFLPWLPPVDLPNAPPTVRACYTIASDPGSEMQCGAGPELLASPLSLPRSSRPAETQRVQEVVPAGLGNVLHGVV